MNDTTTIYIVDDDPKITESLHWLLESVNYHVKSYNSAQAFLDNWSGEYAGCLILDVRMKDMTGLELQEELNKRQINIPIVFMTAHGDIPMTVRAMKKGAVDFLTKPVNGQQLLETVNKALQVQAQQLEQLKERQHLLERIDKLTTREKEIIALLVEGNNNKAIATQLGITVNTVEVHRSNIMKKMQVRAATELIRLATKYNLFNKSTS